MPDHTHTHSAQPSGGALRTAVEHHSAPLVRWLASLPPWLPFLAMLVLILVGAVVGGIVGGVAVGLAAVVVGWLLYLSWPRLRPAERLMRLAVLAVVLAVGVTQLFPR